LYVHRVLAGIQRLGQSAFFQVLIAAARQASAPDEVSTLIEPRLGQLQAMLTAADVTRVDALRLVDIIIAPAYFWAQLGAPLDPDHDTRRLVETALLTCRATSL